MTLNNDFDFAVAAARANGEVPSTPCADDPRAAALNQRPAHGPESFCQPSYAAERKRKLLQIFAGVDRRAQNGWSVARAIRAAARRWNGRTFKSEPGRAINFSEETLSRLYYAWRNAGRDAAVLELRYKPPQPKIAPEVGELVAGIALATDAPSFAAVIREVGGSGLLSDQVSYSTLIRRIPAKTRRTLRGLFQKRGALRRAERAARSLIRTEALR